MTRLALLSLSGLFLFAACGRTAPTTNWCPPGQTRCGAECVDLRIDSGNCGACGSVCADTEVCSEGACTSTCAPGLEACDGACVDTSKDQDNCGACGSACGTGEKCSGGTCATSCTGGRVDCGGICIDTSSDVLHCGACDHACELGETCEASACKSICAPGEAFCAGTGAGADVCANLQSDPANCGACGVTCTAKETCNAGACVPFCAGGLTDCSGVCIDTQNDSSHCGACGNVCAFDQLCSQGTCVPRCAAGQLFCGNVCINPQTNAANCGACGVACPAGVCIGGKCTGPVCTPNSSVSCYSGPLGTAGVGACKAGTKTCNSAGTGYGPCLGQVLPSTELCADAIDSDCDGRPSNELFFESFANNSAGWGLGGEWQIGPAKASMCGLNGAGEDPATDHTSTSDNGVAGVMLGGCYSVSPGHDDYCLVSPMINGNAVSGALVFSFWRHLHTDYLPFIQTRLDLSSNGGVNWTQLWITPDEHEPVNDLVWTKQTFNVTAQKSPQMRVRFCFNSVGANVWSGGGWTIDDVSFGAANACQ